MTDICTRMDYPFLQLRYLEQEMRGGLLHLYTSVFRGCLILRIVELEESLPSVEAPPRQWGP